MAASRSLSSEPAAQEVFSWLRNLPLAPEYHPTVAEFQDPIAYIFKIEKEASSYGICKIVPPVPPAPKKSVVSNFNRSLAARSTESNPTFTTRQQQVGFCPRKPCPVKKPVWQSGENYTFQDFETKARAFEKNYLKKCSKKSNHHPSALEIETLYWKATVDKPISVEYANDMPGSAFTPLSSRKGKRETGEGQGNVGDTNWNMRGVSRWAGSLLKFMKEEIPGVTSPMVYVAMLFSWFAWHVEDHDLHSLNYMHLGAGKTWYGVPRDAAVAFEEVARVHGYGGEVNPLVTFAILGEKTTVISPEVLVGAGVPCCRLVQNAGEFVVTFPRAYHSGFSHGFNCGEAANIATPEWLKFAKEAAIRRASINYPPMVSHFQLLYDLALALCSRVPTTINLVPRSSRLKDKKKSEGESMIKEEFLHDVIQNNNLLHTLCKGSTSWVVLLPQNSSDISSSCQNLHVRANSRLALGLCNPTDEDIKSPERINNSLQRGSSYSMKKKFSSLCERKVSISSYCGNGVDEDPQEHSVEDKTTAHLGDMLSDQRLFSCVTCGILTFSCAAILNPKAPAARCLGSADSSLLNDWTARSIERFDEKTLDSGLRHFGDCNIESPDPRDQIPSSCVQEDKGSSALGLIGLNYGDSSDSEQDDETEHIENKASVSDDLNERSCRNLYSSARFETNATRYGSVGALKPKDTLYVPPIYNEESSRPHVFCLEHAIEVEKQLQPIGGAEIFLICHPDYPKIEAEAKSIAEEIGDDYGWNELAFRSANKEDKERIRAALDSDDATPSSGDWTVKLGANLFYSVRLGWSSLYSKQMPYNPVIHKAFGRRTRNDDEEDEEEYGRRSRKKVVEGKWCGKVWMSNQIHPILAHKFNNKEEETQEEDERHYLHSSDEKPARGRNGNTSSVSKKKKRKMAAKSSRSLKKRKTSLCKEEEEEAVSDEDAKSIENNMDSDNSLEENYRRQQPRGRIYGGSINTKAAEFTPVEDVMNSDVSQSGDSEPPRREFSDEESAPPPKIYSRRKKPVARTDDVTVVSDENSKRPWNLRNKKPKQDLTSPDDDMMSPSLNPGLTKGRISLPVRQRTPRIASKNVAALRLETQVGGFIEEEENEEEHEEEECRGPSTRLRTKKLTGPAKGSGPGKKQEAPRKKSTKKKAASTGSSKVRVEEGGEHGCDIEGCGMSFRLKQELTLHMKNICPVKGCGKKFFSHKYLVQHRRVHDDDRPLKCPWKGCKMTFKWAWARTEHIRVHTGVRPYVCGEDGCGQTFRFVSDFSRHKRKTGHSIKGKA